MVAFPQTVLSSKYRRASCKNHALASAAQLVESCPVHKKGHQFSSLSGHKLRFWVQFPVGVGAGGN